MKPFLSILFGFLLPPLVSWLKRCEWPRWGKLLLALGASLVAALASVAADGQFNWQDLAGTAGVIFTLATVLYQAWFEHTELNAALEEKQVL